MSDYSNSENHSLLSLILPKESVVPVSEAIGKAGAVNAALLAIAILAGSRPELRQQIKDYRRGQADAILAETLE